MHLFSSSLSFLHPSLSTKSWCTFKIRPFICAVDSSSPNLLIPFSFSDVERTHLQLVLHRPSTHHQLRIDLLMTRKTKHQSGCHNRDHSAGGSSIKVQASRQWSKRKRRKKGSCHMFFWICFYCKTLKQKEKLRKRGDSCWKASFRKSKTAAPLLSLWCTIKVCTVLLVPR